MEEAVFKFTKYEKARMIGARALQIAQGAPFLVKIDDEKLKEIRYNPVEIAKLEYDEGVIPLEVLRKIPEFVEDIGRHPMAAKTEGIAESATAEELKLAEEDEEDMETSEDSSAEEEIE
jgi:DNA-directed RNA polymerase subunit K